MILVPGSPFSDSVIMFIKQKQGKAPKEEEEGDDTVKIRASNNLIKLPEDLKDALNDENAHLYIMEDNNSEDIAALLHFFLTVTPY